MFYPSEEEFKDPLNYIEKISSEGKKYGLCKIVPPASWNPTPKIDMSDPMRFPSRNQRIDTLQESVGFDEGKQYNIQEYKDMADNFKKGSLVISHDHLSLGVDSFDACLVIYASLIVTLL